MMQLRPCALVLAAMLGSAPVVWGRPGVPKPTLSDYEKKTAQGVLRERALEEEPSPVGKVVESIELVRLPVVEERDIAPLFMTTEHAPGSDSKLRAEFLAFANRPHVVSREDVIAREVLLKEGDTYTAELADETERNLRALGKRLSIVLCLKARGSSPDKVRLLIVTKDVWSLRFAWDIKASSGGVESLTLAPSETNVAGLHHALTTSYTMSPATHTLSLSYSIPRFGTSFWGASAKAGVIANRASGENEGSFLEVAAVRPLYTTHTLWGVGISGSYTHDVARRFVNARVATFDAKVTPYDDRVPFAYTRDLGALSASASRSFGVLNKVDLSFGASYVSNVYSVPNLGSYEREVADEFRRSNVPTTDHRAYPFAQVRAYTTRFMHPIDVETLALQEDVRLGYDLYAKAYPVLAALGSDRGLLGTFAAAQYTAQLRTGYARVGAEAVTELEGTQVATGILRGNARLVTPRFGIGRLVFDGVFTRRYRNYQNSQEYLGGAGRIRGFPTNFFQGQDVVAWNFEYRAKAMPVLSMQLAPVAFYDVGSASADMLSARLFHSAGVGGRLLIPQLDRVVMRFDVGFPMNRPRGVEAASFFFSVEQAFPLGSVGP